MVNEEEQLRKEIKQLKQQLTKEEPEEKKEKKPFYYKEVSNTTAVLIALLVFLIATGIIYLIVEDILITEKKEQIESGSSELIEKVSELKALSDSAKSHEIQAIKYDKTGDEFYDLATFLLERKDYAGAYTNCQKARPYSLKASQEYRIAKAKWEQAYNILINKPDMQQYEKLKSYINSAINMNDAGAKIEGNHYEACEYIETASHHFLQNDIAMGNQAIDRANEKIKLHDYWVTIFNENSAKRI